MLPTEDKRELELRDYLRIVRRRLPILILTVVLVVGAALSASLLQTPVYQGEAEVLLQTKETPFDVDTGQRSDPQRAIQTEIKVITSQPVRAAVRRQLGSASEVSASPSGQTDIIEVKAQSTDARQAAAVANAYANSYIDFKRRQAVEDLLAASKLIQDRVSALQKEIDSLPAPTPQRTDSRRDALVDLQAQFRQLTDQLQVNRQLVTGGAQLLSPAAIPSSPIKPRPRRNVVLALVGGLLLGFGLAFLFDYLDDSIKSKEDLERSVGALPTIGLIPAIGSWKDRDSPLVVSRSDPSSGPAEAYRTLRTSIHFLALDRPMHTVQITSSNASEGKTTTLANLGVALARSGQRVILVCCDLRRPRLNQFFDLPNDVGFTSVLLGDVPLSAALQQVPGEQRLLLLASGPLPPNPSELLSSKRSVELLTALKANSDIVLIDSPPILPVADALVLAGRVDSTLLVASADRTTRKEVSRAAELLRQVEAPLVGTVLNGVTSDAGYGYQYKYEYYRQDDAA